MSELAREIRSLRLRLTAWYVVVFGSILLAFGIFIYFAADVRVRHRLDVSLSQTVDAVVAALGDAAREPGRQDRLPVSPGHTLYLFDAEGTLIEGPDPPRWVADAVGDVPPGGSRIISHDPDETGKPDAGHDERGLARRVPARAGDFTVVAVADALDLDDRYAPLITTLGLAALLALLATGIGGYFLAGRAARPLHTSFVRMRQFTDMAAHQMRNPLAAIRATAEAAAEDPSGRSPHAAALERIGAEAGQLGTVLDRLLLLARSDAHQLQPGDSLVHLDDVAYDAVARVRNPDGSRGVDIHLEIEGECSVAGDETLLSQMLAALLENAVKHSPPRATIDLTLRAVPAEGVAELTVRDRGPGIPADLADRVFEPFVRATSAGTDDAGVGLGLSIARRIADAHGGQISVEEAEGGGASLRVSLPLRSPGAG